MSIQEKALTYRGDVRAITASDKTLAWVTQHPQNESTAVYKLDVESLELTEAALPCGAVSLLSDDKGIWVGGDDGKLYQLTTKAKTPKAIVDLPATATGLALFAGDRLAALCDTQIVVIDRKTSGQRQTIELPQSGTALASDPTGEWLAAGTGAGTVAVFECEGKDEYLQSEAEKLHDGAVTALLFEPEELRFFSAGADQKLLLTHARGKLEPEDRGRSANHKERVTAMVLAPGDRFITGSRDKTCKSWTRAGATKPATLSDGVAMVVDLTIVQIHGRTHVAVACQDNSIRLFLLDTGGRFGAATHRFDDAYTRASQLLGHKEPAQRGEGLTALADYDDQRSVEMLAAHVVNEKDHALRTRSTELLASAKCPLAAKKLAPLLKNKDGAVRLAAFAGLFGKAEPGDLQPMRSALKANQADVGIAAVNELTKTAVQDENSSRLMIEAIDHKLPEVRVTAQISLEGVLPKDSPDANLTALASSQADARTLGLIRLYQRKMLDRPRVEAALRRAAEDPDVNVRRNAFLISLLAREKLASAVRFLDKDLHRQLFDLESFSVQPSKAKAKELPKAKKASIDLAPDDVAPLLTAIASRAADTALSGARCLAWLGDPRALGMLLQLSREEDAKARGQVCTALAALGDVRAVGRLESMLDDDAVEVRDAAFTAYAQITADDRLRAAEAGLVSKHEDVRRRALQSLVAFLRKAKKNQDDKRARGLLTRVLNDSSASVRGEAFKAALNIQVDGGQDATLRFVLGSVHADIRREVLTEVIAEEKQAWAWALLLELFADPDAKIRSDAFEHAVEKTKKRDVAPMQAALQGPFVDIRLLATRYLIGLSTPEAQAVLATVVDDDDRKVRMLALEAIIDRDAADLLSAAMSSQHGDVRLRAACARAVHGDDACRQPLIDLLTAEEPEDSEDNKRWKANVLTALSGIADLGDPAAAEPIEPLLQHQDANVRGTAIGALIRLLDASPKASLQRSLQHADPQVKYNAAVGLAICGDADALPVVFAGEAKKILADDLRLTAAVVYDALAETQLAHYLDADEDWIRNATLLVLLSRDLLDHDGTPRRAMACLSARAPRVRLFAARAVEAFADSDAFVDLLLQQLNDRGESADWEISKDDLLSLAQVLVFASSSIRFRVIAALKYLAADKQDAWDLQWSVIRERFADEIDAAAAAANKQELPKSSIDSEQRTQIAFGTYVALVREQGGYHERGNRPSFGATVIAVRQTALRRLLEIAQHDASREAAARPVLIQALGDPNQAVRTLAFEQLADVGVDTDSRAFAAIESGHVDLAVKGMQLLTSDADAGTARKVLQDVILGRADALALEAAQLLADKTSRVEAATISLDSPSDRLRVQAVMWLVADYDENQEAKQRLGGALDSKYRNVRTQAAIGLADKQDERAFDALVTMLSDQQPLAIRSLAKLGNPKGAEAAMDRVENDPEKTAKTDLLFNLIGGFRNVENVDRLLGMMRNKPWRDQAAAAVRTISGFDQPIEDPDDERVDQTWQQKQHPRHDDVLAKLIERHLELDSSVKVYPPLIRDARWSRSSAVDDVLARLASHPDDNVRRQTVQALGWRLHKRDGAAQPLISALQHRDPDTKFLAAEGLALAGHNDGINVLMSAVELLSDLRLRERAVFALGELADPLSLDLLLRLAGDDQHALQAAAARAIGHLSETDEAERILELLKRLASEPGTAAPNALYGLRYFNTADAWTFLRDRAGDPSGLYRQVAIVQLGCNDDPATKDLLLKILAGDSWYGEYLIAARRLFGADSLEPDYAVLKAKSAYQLDMEEEHHCVHRVCEAGDSAEIMKMLPACYCEVQSILAANLLQRDPLPIEAASETLVNSNATSVDVAAHILGRSGDPKFGKAIVAAINQWTDRWYELHAKRIQRNDSSDQLALAQQCLQRLIWAAGRTQAGKAELLSLLESNREEIEFSPIRDSAISALASYKLSKTDLTAISKLTEDTVSSIRRKAAQLLAQEGQIQSLQQAALSDRSIFQSIVAQGGDVTALTESAAADTHHQSIVIPELIKAGKIDTLAEVAGNNDLNELVRMGAIEGLGRIHSTESQQQLVAIAKTKGMDEELQKAAWRSLRRSKRLMQK